MTVIERKRRPDLVGRDTPWGVADGAVEYAPGIVFFETPSHGGLWLSKARLAEMPARLRAVKPFCGVDGWYEEDCDWAIVALAFPDLFEPEHLEIAKRTRPELVQEGGAV